MNLNTIESRVKAQKVAQWQRYLINRYEKPHKYDEVAHQFVPLVQNP